MRLCLVFGLVLVCLTYQIEPYQIESFGDALEKSAGFYQDPVKARPYSSNVLIVSCNFAVMDILMNWGCHANRLGLIFLLVSMDKELAKIASENYFEKVIPYVYHGTPKTWKSNKIIDPMVHNAWRNGQFNLVSLYKVASVRDAISAGYNVFFSDVDIVFLNDPIPSFLPTSPTSPSGVIQPLPDFLFQQNIGGWWGDEWESSKKDEGNSGLYFMQSSQKSIEFLDNVINRCWKQPKLDDQTNLFLELGLWKKQGYAISCVNSESKATPIHGFYWPSTEKQPSSVSRGVTYPIYYCPMPRLPFASGYAHRVPELWQTTLAQLSTKPILLHFNCLGRGGGHDVKRFTIEKVGLWHWNDAEHQCILNGSLSLQSSIPPQNH